MNYLYNSVLDKELYLTLEIKYGNLFTDALADEMERIDILVDNCRIKLTDDQEHALNILFSPIDTLRAFGEYVFNYGLYTNSAKLIKFGKQIIEDL